MGRTKVKSSRDGFTENDIRPDHLNEGKLQKVAADARRVLSYAPQFVRVNCPACGSAEKRLALEKNGLRYDTCVRCETMYVNPRPTPEILAKCYAESEVYAYWNQYIFPASEEARRTKIFRPRAVHIAEICRRHGSEMGALLEVGAGFGTFCEEIIRLGVFRRVIAVEPTPDLAATCRRKGLEVLEKPIEQVSLQSLGPVSAVCSFEVIEHLFSPREFLRACSRLMTAGGLLVVSCPNIKGFDLTVLGKLAESIDHEHLNYFNPKSLAMLVESCGLGVIETLTPGKLDAEIVRKKVLAGEMNLDAQPFLRQVLIDEWERVGETFQGFLADNLLSSHLWLVARKS